MHYVTAMGTDAISGAMMASGSEGVHTDLVQRLDHKLPGLYLIETDEQGERIFHLLAQRCRRPVLAARTRGQSGLPTVARL